MVTLINQVTLVTLSTLITLVTLVALITLVILATLVQSKGPTCQVQLGLYSLQMNRYSVYP